MIKTMTTEKLFVFAYEIISSLTQIFNLKFVSIAGHCPTEHIKDVVFNVEGERFSASWKSKQVCFNIIYKFKETSSCIGIPQSLVCGLKENLSCSVKCGHVCKWIFDHTTT